jgi:hypothetical protein
VAHPAILATHGRDQEDHGLKLAWANSSMRPYLEKNPPPKRAGGVTQGVDPEFKLQYCQKIKIKKEINYWSKFSLIKYGSKFVAVAHPCNPRCLIVELGGSCFKASPGKNLPRLCLKEQARHCGTHL